MIPQSFICEPSGNQGHKDALITYDNETNSMKDIIDKSGLSEYDATHSAVSIDLDKDGYSDLIIARANGVFIYKNNKNGTFTKRKIMEKRNVYLQKNIIMQETAW